MEMRDGDEMTHTELILLCVEYEFLFSFEYQDR